MATRSSKKSRTKASSSKAGTQDNTPRAEGEQQSGPVAGTALVAGATFGLKSLLYADVDGLAIFEGDIILGTTSEVQATADASVGALPQAAVVVSNVAGQQLRWPNATIPFEIDASAPNPQRINDAIAHWHANTRIRFVQRTAANAAQFPDFVRFVAGSQCASMVGRRGGRQDITMTSACQVGNLIHELGHAVGLWHEQSREDRDRFIRIVFSNVQPSMVHNFSQHISDGDDIGPYDYGSIMHYPPVSFAIDTSQPTIIPLQPLAPGVVLGQRTGLSPNDINAINTIYPAAAPPPPTIKETVKDPVRDPGPTIKEIRKDPIQDITIKAIRKDPIQDPTLKEVRRDPIFERFPRFGIPGLNFDPNAGASPFIAATQSHFGGQGDAVAEVSAQVAELAQALVLLEQQQAELLAAYDQAVQTLEALSQGNG